MTQKNIVRTRRGLIGAGLLALTLAAGGAFASRSAHANSATDKAATAAAAEPECTTGEMGDAAFCSSGGWAYAGCCGTAYTKWTKPGQVKCCGMCMR